MTERRRVLIWAAAVYGGILAMVAAGLLLLYHGSRQPLDEALGQRLLAVAETAAHLVDGDAVLGWSYDPQPDLDLLWLATRLERIRLDQDLAEITLCDPQARVLISASRRLAHGQLNVFWELDRPAVALAREGLPAATRLYRAGSLYQKSAHAPIFDRHAEVAAILTVEGNADFFGALAVLRRTAAAIIVAACLGLSLLGLLLWRSQRSLERARLSLLERENLAAMGRLTAGIAHEIRNPLGIIRGAGQHLQRLLADHGVEDEVARFIPEEVDRLDRILGDYLTFGDDVPRIREDVDLAALIRRTARLAGPELQGSGVAIEVAEPLRPARIDGDSHRLQQILLNLLLNARDAMPRGGAVRISLLADDRWWRVEVADEGRGLGAVTPEQAFAPFWSSKADGGGLGLSVSRRLAVRHGGDLTLQERPGGGCTACLTLPREADGGPVPGPINPCVRRHDGQDPPGG